ncbi:molybdopterin cofactor-binding domain-containing protein [Rhizobium sp. BR 314]|uniref:molybdopterin cofactor-binding domain-containing protein n=1 Tax=Rhizobium sp. BR 314 TaxID=3040013 RepID=UPI0039BF969A
MTGIGTRTRHVDWEAITDGSAIYAADLHLQGELAAAVLRSPHPHARIISIDTSRARALPGVHAVLTAADLPESLYLDYRVPDRDRRILADGLVRHVGEPVALIAADDVAIARHALELIDIRYQHLPVADTVTKALSPLAPAIHPHTDTTNIASHVRRTFGLPIQDIPTPSHSVTASFTSARQTHATMEPHTVKAHWIAEEGCLHVWAPSQNPRLIQRDLAQLFGLEPASVRLHELAIGGDFGGRTQISSTEALVCALSLATARPVALHQSRPEEFAFTKWRLSWEIDLELGCDAAGKVTTLAAKFDVDNGAYNQAGPGEMAYGSIALGSSYRWLGYQAEGRCVYTNKVPASSFRGAGGYAINWALECAIDELAGKAGIDPIDFRLANAVGDEDEISVTGWQIKSSGLRRCLEAVRKGIDWDEKRQQGGKGRGVGVACTIHVTALSRDYMLRSSCALDIDRNGHVTIRSGCGDSGTGQKTLICQTVATILNLPMDQISIITTDTLVTPHDAGAGASRGSFVAVNAAQTLAGKVRSDLSALASAHFGGGEVEWTNGEIRKGNHVIQLGELALLAGGAAELYSMKTDYAGQFHDADPHGYEDISPTYSFAAHAVEVEVDEKTGLVRVLKVVAAHDSGTILNPISARGQVEGGVVMGLGAVLGESLIFEEGRVVNSSYVDYMLPRFIEAPAVETIFVDVTDKVGPYGSKGLGEIPLITIGPAVSNAIAHATGLRLRSAPHTPDQIVMAARQRDGKPLRAGSIATRPGRWWVEGVRTAYPRGLHKSLRRLAERLGGPRAALAIEGVRSADTLGQALDLLNLEGNSAPIAGGTDLLALETQGLPLPGELLVDVCGLSELRGIELRTEGSLRIGSMVTLADLATSKSCGAALNSTAALIATPQIRRIATVGGNLCQTKRCWFFRNGFDCYKRGGATRPCYAVMGDHRYYHAVQDAHRCQAVTPSDLATTLVALDARLEIRRAGEIRPLDVDRLYRGPGETRLKPGELISAIEIPAEALRRRSVYRKLALAQGAFAVATACVSANVGTEDRLSDLRVVLGGVSSVPQRVRSIERSLNGRRPTRALIKESICRWLGSTHPLSDNHWKAFAVGDMLEDLLSRDLVGMELA